MTIEEVKNKYGGADGYVYCYDCPLNSLDEDACLKYGSNIKGMEDCHRAILNYLTEKETNTCSMVNHPSHYNQGGMECIDEMILVFGKEATMDFCLCNAWKYRYRANAKNGQEDLDKANWYLAKYKELKEELA